MTLKFNNRLSITPVEEGGGEGGEILTVTNKSSQNVQTGDRVWINTKELEATKMGNVSIDTSFIASSFQQSNYIKYNKHFDFSKPWEFKCKVFRNDYDYGQSRNAFIYSSVDSTGESLYTAGFGLFLGAKFVFNFKVGGTEYDIGGGTVSINTTYWIKCGWSGTEYYLKYSTDDTTYTSVGTVQSTAYVTQTNDNINIGSSNWVTGFYWKGTIDLKEMSMTIDNEVVWKGVSDISPKIVDFDYYNIYTLTGTSKDNIAINASGDVVVGGYINNQDKSVTANGTYTADAGYTGLGTVNVNVTPRLGAVNIPATTSAQTVKAAPNFDGFYRVTVPAVTYAIDSNIQSRNIKDGVTILGVTGTYSGSGVSIESVIGIQPIANINAEFYLDEMQQPNLNVYMDDSTSDIMYRITGKHFQQNTFDLNSSFGTWTSDDGELTINVDCSFLDTLTYTDEYGGTGVVYPTIHAFYGYYENYSTGEFEHKIVMVNSHGCGSGIFMGEGTLTYNGM